jgi:hypothetical protein
MLIQSFDRHSEVAEFDPMSESIQTMARSSTLPTGLAGHYAHLDDALIVLYRDGHNLWLKFGDTRVPLHPSSRAEYYRAGARRSLRVQSDSKDLQFTYHLKELDPPLSIDFTPGVEEEDFDFGLFISNVVNNPERQERLYRESV